MSDETFVYDGETPELRAYLTHVQAPPPRAEAWEAERRRLLAALPEGLLSRYDRARVAWHCRDATRAKDPTSHLSDSGHYRLDVTVHPTGRGTWAYTKGRIYDGERLIAEVCRNYHSFPFTFVERHPNGHDYLVCGEDYQGQTFIQLDTGRRADHLPKATNYGFGFCWADVQPSPSKRTLAVGGCYWGAPYEVWFVDFDDPMSWPPIVLKREPDLDKFLGWVGDDVAEYGRVSEVYTANNKTADECTDEELAEWERREAAGEKVTGERRDAAVRWERPSPVEIAREYIGFLRRHWLDRGLSVAEEFRENAERLAARLTDEERATLPSLDEKPRDET